MCMVCECVNYLHLISNLIIFKVQLINVSKFEINLIKISSFPQAVNAVEDIDTETAKLIDLKLYVLSSNKFKFKVFK